METDYIVEMKGISKTFGAVQALKKVDLELRRGEIMGIVGDNGAGLLYVANLAGRSLYRLPLTLPHPLQFTLQGDGRIAYLADPGGTLYCLDTVTLSLSCWGQSDSMACVGLAIGDECLYTAWELADSGVMGVFNLQGKMIAEYPVPGIPTNILFDNYNRVIVPFTATETSGEGIIIFDSKKDATQPTTITIQCPQRTKGLRAYPCQVALSPDGCTAYVVNEDSGSVSIVDMNTRSAIDYIPVGRSISSLHLLPDSRFAVAASNMFAELCLIDLVNRRLLSFTTTSREILGFIAVIPK
jgi:YVTN family beta-propeller protein